MKTKNKNYEEYIDNYESSWKDVLDVISDKMIISTLGGKVTTDPRDCEAKVLAIYSYNNRDAMLKCEAIRNLGYNVTIESGYGPGIVIVHKK